MMQPDAQEGRLEEGTSGAATREQRHRSLEQDVADCNTTPANSLDLLASLVPAETTG
jgi:hypothetical protein